MSYFAVLFGIIFLYKQMINYANSIDAKSALELEEIREKNKFKYISNESTIEGSLFRYYLKQLDLENEKVIYIDLVFNSYQKHLQFLNEDLILGYKVKTNKKNLRLSHDYLVDLCDYMGNLN